MPQPRRYKCTSWNLTKKQGVAIDGTKFEGEFIGFVVRGVDLDSDYNGFLVPGEEFYANESPNHLLYDVVVETGPRGLISQTNFEAQQAARCEVTEPKSMTEYTQQILDIVNSRPVIDYSKLSEPVTMSAEEFAANRQQVNEQEQIEKAADWNFKFTKTPAPGELIEDVGKVYIDPVRAHVEHLEDLLTNLKRETNLIVAYLDVLAPLWRGIAGLEQENQLERLGISVAKPEPYIPGSNELDAAPEKVDEFSNETDNPSPEASGQAL